jgi:DNA invertase Pin-like site-specific DNA recombinase
MVTKGRRAGIYARLSQDRALEKVSVSRQIKECQELAARNGWEVVEIFQDRDVSASNRNAKRPGYEGLLDALRSGRVNAVLARESSRLYRRPLQLEDLIDLSEGKGIEISTVYEGEIDLSTSNGRMFARFRVNIDKAESERIAERVKSSLPERRAAGKHLGGGHRPYGYDKVVGTIVTTTNSETGEKIKHDREITFAVNSAEAKVIKEVAHRIIAGESAHRVTLDLNERGIPTSGGGRWKPAHLKRLLLRELPTAFKPILKADERETLKALLNGGEKFETRGDAAKAASKAPRPGARRFVLTGIVFCSRCDARMIGSGGNDSHGRYYELYRCAARNSGCGKNSIGAKRLEVHAHNELRRHFDTLKLAFLDVQNEPPVDEDEPVLGEIRDVQSRIDALAENLDLSEHVLATRTRALEAKLADLRSKIRGSRQSATRDTPKDIIDRTLKLYERWMNRELTASDVNVLHDAFASVIEQIRVLPKRPDDPTLEPLKTVKERVVIEWRK